MAKQMSIKNQLKALAMAKRDALHDKKEIMASQDLHHNKAEWLADIEFQIAGIDAARITLDKLSTLAHLINSVTEADDDSN